jgi:hypothetical protein
MATTMAARGSLATWCCILAAVLELGSVRGQDLPSNWDVPNGWEWDGTLPVSDVPSYQNGHRVPVDFNKPNRIFICNNEFVDTTCQ